MRKWLLALSVAGLVAVTLVCSLYFDADGMDIKVIGAKKAQKIEEEISRQEAAMDIALIFDGEKLPYDMASKTFFLPVSMQNEQWEQGSFEVGEGEEIVFAEDFTKGDKLELLGENRAIPFYVISDAGYGKYYLKLTGLPVMSFEYTEHVTENGEVLFQMALYEPEHDADWVTKALTTSTLRGNTSLSYEKKSLRLKLKEQKEDGSYKKENKNLLGIRDDDDWILNSLYADNSRIRDKLAMDLWQEVGANQNPYGRNFGVTGEFVEVVVNGAYAGLYLLTHPIDGKQIGSDKVSVQLASGEEVVERVYKKKYTAPWLSEYFIGQLPDPNMQDYRGGWHVKGDVVLGDEGEWKPLYDMARCMESDDAGFRETIGEIADISNIVDNWLFFQAIAGFDNENKNVYYAVMQKGSDSYGYFIPWDMNISFGALYAENEYFCTESEKEMETIIAFQPGLRAVELDAGGSRSLVKEKWNRWRQGAFDTDKILAHMDRLNAEIINSGAMAREIERWPDGNANEDITFMKEFTEKRLEFLDGYVEKLTQ